MNERAQRQGGSGRFITLEGPDGAGKSIHAERLAAGLRARGPTVALVPGPGGTAPGGGWGGGAASPGGGRPPPPPPVGAGGGGGGGGGGGRGRPPEQPRFEDAPRHD